MMNNDNAVHLDWFEVFRGAFVGVMREIDARKKQRGDQFASADSWGGHIEGACAELAVARTLKRYWHALVSDPHTVPGDVGGYQVRSTTHASGHLVIYERDPTGSVFVLVTGRAPDYVIRGWYVSPVKPRSHRFWREDVKRPALWVPQHELHPMKEVPL